jgi:hypothetical protein
MDKTNNTKYAAQQIVDIIHSWVPTCTTDPDTQHELTQGFRIIQTRMMVLAVIHGLRPNQKLKSILEGCTDLTHILEGCTDLTHLWGSTLHAHNLFSRPFFQSQSVYLRFTHIVNMQPKFYIGSAMHHTLDREYSRSRKYLQLTNAPTPVTTTIRIHQPADSTRDPNSIPFRPWTDMEDQELINLKNDTKSRPSWNSIGARLRRDPQVCKLRWGILKQMSDQHGLAPPHEPEAED